MGATQTRYTRPTPDELFSDTLAECREATATIRDLLNDLDAHLANMDGPAQAHNDSRIAADLTNGVRNRVREAQSALREANRAAEAVKVSLDNKSSR